MAERNEVHTGNTNCKPARHWCFTDHSMDLFDWDDKRMRYIVYQDEIGEEGGKEHIQGYVEFKQTVKLSYLKKLNPQIHWEIRRGSREEARDYCMKDDTRKPGTNYKTYGKWEAGGSGARNDLHKIHEELKEGKSIEYIATNNFSTWCKNYRAIEKYKNMICKKRNWEMHIVWVHGPSGSGKTKWVIKNYPDLFIKGSDDTWFDGYNNESAILIDDIDKDNKFNRNFMLRFTDRYPMKLPYKGGFHEMTSKYIVFTSNYEPEEIYPNDDAVLRRITVIKNIDCKKIA